jgi:very-short-patch-repair endonuclease
MGLRVIRFWNGEVEKNLAEVLRKIRAELNESL